MEYKTIEKQNCDEFTEKKSRFIGYAKPVKTQKEAADFIAEIKQKHRDATHNVPAYVLRENNIQHSSDDGEPSGTAGMPVLDVMLKEGIVDACVVVTRYFGGVLLGTGGLVRAYSKSASLALEQAGSVEVCECAVFEAEVEYSLAESFERFLKDNGGVILSKDYAQKVTLSYCVRVEKKDEFSQKITNHFSAQIKPDFIKNSFEEL